MELLDQRVPELGRRRAPREIVEPSLVGCLAEEPVVDLALALVEPAAEGDIRGR